MPFQMTHENRLIQAAIALKDALVKTNLRLVLAESCTAGKVASSLAVLPGISNWLCGSFVVYRNESKACWLSIPRELLEDRTIGPVSSQVTLLLARSALSLTPEASLSVAVTGHIGPGCPTELDGAVFFACARRWEAKKEFVSTEKATVLTSPAPHDERDFHGRSLRLSECALWVLEQAHESITSAPSQSLTLEIV